MLSCQQLKFSYTQHPIVQNLTFTLPKGEHLLIMGASGSGKSTLLALLTGMLRPQQGNIMYDDTDITTLSPSQLDRFRGQHLSIVFQHYHLIPVISVIENITIALRAAHKTCDSAHVHHILERLNLSSKTHCKVQQLSIGEMQRTALARAIITQPQWIFCDEPTSALDDTNTQATLELLESEAKLCGASLITVTHDARVRHHFSHHTLLQLPA